MALYLLPRHKGMTEQVARASSKPVKPGFATDNAIGTPDMGNANSAVLLAVAPPTIWGSMKGVTRWM